MNAVGIFLHCYTFKLFFCLFVLFFQVFIAILLIVPLLFRVVTIPMLLALG